MYAYKLLFIAVNVDLFSVRSLLFGCLVKSHFFTTTIETEHIIHFSQQNAEMVFFMILNLCLGNPVGNCVCRCQCCHCCPCNPDDYEYI